MKQAYTINVPFAAKEDMPIKVGFSYPTMLSAQEQVQLKEEIKHLLAERNAVLISHYYTSGEIQDITEETHGCVADSLEMARFGHDHEAETLVVSGVRFMGESAKILSPQKNVIMPDLEATCSLDAGCPEEAFSAFCSQYPDREIVVYANTSAEIKAMADWVATSSIAVELLTYLKSQNKKVIWGPDKHLGSYLQRKTGADMVLWQGSCVVHDEFKGLELLALKKQHPDAKVLVHPESPQSVVDIADMVGSTSQLLQYSATSESRTFIVATDVGIFHKMRARSPDKTFLAAPTAGTSATCKSCAHCPWMAMNDLKNLRDALKNMAPAITVPEDIRTKAYRSLERMLQFSKNYKKPAASPHQPDLGVA